MNPNQQTNEDCVFCRIVAGAAPASIVYDDPELLAFMDIRPVTPGHLLVIPKTHAPYLADLVLWQSAVSHEARVSHW